MEDTSLTSCFSDIRLNEPVRDLVELKRSHFKSVTDLCIIFCHFSRARENIELHCVKQPNVDTCGLFGFNDETEHNLFSLV